jgi:hypothetical protein
LLVAICVLIYGLVRAIVMNRRIQVVVEDLVGPIDSGEFTRAAQLSPVLRQYVRRDIQDQREQTARVGTTILRSASPDLEPQLRNGTFDNIQRTANDSITAVSAALRAMVPEQADRFLGLFSVLLPPPRGLSVTVTLLMRGTDLAPRRGAAVDVIWLDGNPLASTTFWESSPESSSPAASQISTSEGILALLEPISRWIAVRLVVTLLASSRYRSASHQSRGLKRLLAGGLFLAAMRDFPAHALAFGEQARTELEQASSQMPDMPLPLTTLAGVYERIGWARRAAGDVQRASDEFRAAVQLWEKAQDLTSRSDNAAELTELIDRRLKAQLESEHPQLQAAAMAELAGLDSRCVPPALLIDPVWLYNRACLYAQASEVNPDGGYQKRALRWLGIALIRNTDTRFWEYAAQDDPELAPIRGILATFLSRLRNVIPQTAQTDELDVETLVVRALTHVDGTD